MPFSGDEFFSVFARYNEAIWPLQIFAYVVGIAIVALLAWRSGRSAIAILLILASMWAVNGIGYQWLFFAKVNPIARAFGGIFLLEAIILAVSPWVFSDSISFAIKADSRSAAGLALIAYAALLYPLCGFISGHAYPATPVFGVTPCPTTIFTVGVLLMGNWRAMRWLLVIPVIWSAIGGSAAFLLRVPEDFGLIAALVVLIFFYFAHGRGLKVSRHLVST